MNKITDWAEVMSDKIVAEVRAYMDFKESDEANALECILSQSCAGPESVRRARAKLGLV